MTKAYLVALALFSTFTAWGGESPRTYFCTGQGKILDTIPVSMDASIVEGESATVTFKSFDEDGNIESVFTGVELFLLGHENVSQERVQVYSDATGATALVFSVLPIELSDQDIPAESDAGKVFAKIPAAQAISWGSTVNLALSCIEANLEYEGSGSGTASSYSSGSVDAPHDDRYRVNQCG